MYIPQIAGKWQHYTCKIVPVSRKHGLKIGQALHCYAETASSPNLDVGSVVVTPKYNKAPLEAERQAAALAGTTLNILFCSESGICRAPLAVAAFAQALQSVGLTEKDVQISSRSTANYCIGQTAAPRAKAVAAEYGLEIPEDYTVVQFREDSDSVFADLILVFDKFTAQDVLREVTLMEWINPRGGYGAKVRKLGEFHPEFFSATEDEQTDLEQGDIEDALWGNQGGKEELFALRKTAEDIVQACDGLAMFLYRLKEKEGAQGGLKSPLSQVLSEMKTFDWLVPPMLSPKTIE